MSSSHHWDTGHGSAGHEPGAHEPGAHEPDAHEPDAHEPDAHEPDAHEPDAHAAADGAVVVAGDPARLAPRTGDPAIDTVLAELDTATGEPLAQHIVAGERVHEVLQGRLADLGGA